MGISQAIPIEAPMGSPWISGSTARKPSGISVLVHQPALPHYRVPLFQSLSQRPGIHLKVLYELGRVIPNTRPKGFDGEPTGRSVASFGGQELWWSTSQWRAAGSEKVDVLLLNWNLHYASLIPTLLRAKLNGIPTILWGHGYSKHESALRRWPREKVAGLATALLLYNHSTARHFLDMGYDPARVFVALNTLDQTPIQAARKAWLDDPAKLDSFRRRHDLIDRPAILFVSRLDPGNRADLLIHATARLARTHPRVHAVIIGKGPDEPRLRALARRLNIASRIRFLGAMYDEFDLAPWFLSASAFCYPANIGLSVLHAFGYGLPVVTGDQLSSHNPEIEALQHGVNGLFFQHGMPASLADALNPLIVDPAFRARLSDAARDTALNRFTLSGMVDGMTGAIHYAAQFARR